MANSKMSSPIPGPLIDKAFSNGDNNPAFTGSYMNESDILHSWKDISTFLDRGVRTCIRWERELGLPVHRIDEESSRSKVFAYKSEIDQWLKERSNNKNNDARPIWRNKGLIIGLTVGSFLLGLFFASLYFIKSTSVSSLSEPSITVLPFENINSSGYEEYFSEGITNEIEKSLIRLNRIKVIPASENNPHQSSSQELTLIDDKLKPDYLVRGKLRKDGDRVWININLVRMKDNENIWNEVYESDQKDIFSVKQNISQKIHENLGIDVDENLLVQSTGGNTQDYSAFDAYLKGNFILNRIVEQDDDPWKLYHQGKYYVEKYTQEGNELAISLFNQALEIDGNYALAYIGLAQCYVSYVNMELDSDIEWLNKAESLLKKAQQISPDLPEYYSTLIEINLLKEDCFNVSTSEVVFDLAERAIGKYPNHPQLNSITGYGYFVKFGEKGDEADFEKALDYKEKSFLLNPSSINNIKFAELLMLRKEFYKALEVCFFIEKSESSLLSKSMLGEIYYFSGDLDKSREIFLQLDFPLNFIQPFPLIQNNFVQTQDILSREDLESFGKAVFNHPQKLSLSRK